MAVITLMSVATPKCLADRRSKSRSLMPTARPMPMMGPINGEMSMAPMMTAVELTFKPSDAIRMAKISTHRLAPRNATLLLICSMVCCSSNLSGCRLKYSLTRSQNAIFFQFRIKNLNRCADRFSFSIINNSAVL